jgi:transposase
LGKLTREVREATGYSAEWIREISRRYNERGAQGLGDRRHEIPDASPLLCASEQRQLSEALERPPRDGGLWNSRKVAEWIEERTGRRGLRAQRGWEYLRRLGYTPQVPSPSNAEADPEQQEAFKKSFPSG